MTRIEDDTKQWLDTIQHHYHRWDTEFHRLFTIAFKKEPCETYEEDVNELWRNVRDLTCEVHGMYEILKTIGKACENVDGFYKVFFSFQDWEIKISYLQARTFNLKLGKLDCIY